MPDKTPYLSFCVFSRNDDHGGNMYQRMQTCLMGFFEQAERHRLPSEIVLVDWNPPNNRPLLKDLYQWPSHSRFCTIRIITAPPHIHQRFQHWEKIPVNYCVAENAAIRRARGKFILSTCVDNLLSDELISFLSLQNLDGNKIYRTNRYDVRREVTRLKSLDEQLNYCRKNIVYAYSFLPNQPLPGLDGVPGLYTGAPGDFTLLARKYWHQVCGYPEIDIFGRASGSMLCYMAYFAGAKVEALLDPMCLYHIDHDLRTRSPESNWWSRSRLRQMLPEVFVKPLKTLVRQFLPARDEIVSQNIPHMNYSEATALIIDMFEGRRSYIYNDESWGLGQEELQEFLVTAAEFEAEVSHA